MDEAIEPVIPTGAVYIPRKDVAFIWGLVKPYVEECLAHTMGEMEADDVRDRLLGGSMQLFIAYYGCVKGIIVTEVVNYPQKRALRGYLIAGSEFEAWAPTMQEKLERYCKYMACDYIETVCRPGLAEKLKPLGWKTTQVMLTYRSA